MTTTDAHKVANLAMLVARLVHQVRRHDPDNATAVQAMDYMRRCDLQGSVLRSILAGYGDAQPITPEWCLANGAVHRNPYYFFDDSSRIAIRPIGRGDAWVVIVSDRMLDWTATTTEQIERLRQALKGGV